MSKTDIFISKSLKVHADKYDYSLVEYLGCLQKVKIICKVHNRVFEQTPNDHLNGRGCKLCGIANTKSKQTSSPDAFLKRAQALHGDKIIYNLAEYVNTKTKISMYCKDGEHYFEQSPEKHLASMPCPICSKIHGGRAKASTTEAFISSATKVHCEKYDYSSVKYINNSTKVTVKCNACDQSFEAHPANHLNGRGCPSCAKTGYKRNKPGSLYIMKCGDITKVGITNLNVATRLKDISRSFGSDFFIQTIWGFLDGAIADDVETAVLRTLRDKYERPTAKFEGSSECFLNVDYDDLVRLINREVENLRETT